MMKQSKEGNKHDNHDLNEPNEGSKEGVKHDDNDLDYPIQDMKKGLNIMKMIQMNPMKDLKEINMMKMIQMFTP